MTLVSCSRLSSSGRRLLAVRAVLASLALFAFVASPARAQPAPPKFQYVAPDPAKLDAPAEMQLQARGGLTHLGGNSGVLTGSLGVLGSYQKSANRFSGEAGLAYARTDVLTLVDANGNALVDAGELERKGSTTSRLFQVKGRYDRFFTLNNAGYVSLQALTDTPAGKELVAGGQVGYSRQLLKSDHNRLVAELGYDLSLERAAAVDAELVQVHSARVYISEELKLSEATGLFTNVEALFNLNEEKAPAPGFAEVPAFEDTRLLGRTGLNTKLWQNLSFAFSFGLRYDNAPAPLKAPAGTTYAPTYLPLARKWDTTTEATLVMTFF